MGTSFLEIKKGPGPTCVDPDPREREEKDLLDHGHHKGKDCPTTIFLRDIVLTSRAVLDMKQELVRLVPLGNRANSADSVFDFVTFHGSNTHTRCSSRMQGKRGRTKQNGPSSRSRLADGPWARRRLVDAHGRSCGSRSSRTHHCPDISHMMTGLPVIPTRRCLG